jgi:hypothetical protein
MSNQSDKEEFQNIPESCSDAGGSFKMGYLNNTDTKRDVQVSVFHEDTEILYQEASLGPESDDNSNSESIHGVGCFGEAYQVEVDVTGYEPEEYSFLAETGGFLTIAINPDELFIIYTLGD